MTNYTTGAVRDTGGKGRMDLLPMCALLRVSKHMEDALTHYPERNWEKGLPMHCMIDSAMRHLVKYMDGWIDEDHLCAAATNLLMAMWTEEKEPDMQDIPARLDWTPDGSMGTAKSKPMECECYTETTGEGRCLGTKERGLVSCGGMKDRCIYAKQRQET